MLSGCKGSEPAPAAKSDAKADAKSGEQKAEEKQADDAGAEGAQGGGEEQGGSEGSETETETGETGEAAAPLPENFDKLEVEACDQYVSDYLACIETKVPEDQREAQKRVVFNNIEVWKQTKASGPSAAAALQIGCRSAREQAKRETQAWGCEW